MENFYTSRVGLIRISSVITNSNIYVRSFVEINYFFYIICLMIVLEAMYKNSQVKCSWTNPACDLYNYWNASDNWYWTIIGIVTPENTLSKSLHCKIILKISIYVIRSYFTCSIVPKKFHCVIVYCNFCKVINIILNSIQFLYCLRHTS